MDVLVVWILVLPLLGVGVSGMTFLVWLNDNHKRLHRTWLQSLKDFSHNWPMLAIVAVGLSIVALVLFHDSVHCITGNPMVTLHNPHQTLQCIINR